MRSSGWWRTKLLELLPLDLRAINSPDVFKTLPSKTGDFDGHTA
jgi:hypothetical protein